MIGPTNYSMQRREGEGKGVRGEGLGEGVCGGVVVRK